ncbi:unnamed protein product [Paramecium pentaurelia]|uniref:Uncharacterized protein n=1 Tax=Paramecium pentaurelia TaxID=43138 RepID=A0A8S1UFJ3_9CILI|nr:unnamed protein product [Paramecium pentaurelia]
MKFPFNQRRNHFEQKIQLMQMQVSVGVLFFIYANKWILTILLIRNCIVSDTECHLFPSYKQIQKDF